MNVLSRFNSAELTIIGLVSYAVLTWVAAFILVLAVQYLIGW